MKIHYQYQSADHDSRHARRDKELQKYAKKNKKRAVSAETFTSSASDVSGIVGAVHFGGCIVHIGGERRLCRLVPGVAVGDEVHVSNDQVVALAPRTTTLSRPDPENPHMERVIAANVDVVVIVTCVGTPPFRPGLIDRMLVAVGHGGAQPLLCVNKIELRSENEDLSVLETHRGLGLRVITTSCATGDGIEEELRGAIRARTCVFAGHSGVGKSSLINALFPELAITTGEVGKKGRHTTTSSCLHEEQDGTRVIDTPGIREFGLWRIGPKELPRYFPEFAQFADRCRYRDCTHTHEPQCAVKTAGLGTYEYYLRLRRSLAT